MFKYSDVGDGVCMPYPSNHFEQKGGNISNSAEWLRSTERVSPHPSRLQRSNNLNSSTTASPSPDGSSVRLERRYMLI